MLDKLISASSLEALAGGTAFRRGEDYFAAGAVGRLRWQENKVTAKVDGTETFDILAHLKEGDSYGTKQG